MPNFYEDRFKGINRLATPKDILSIRKVVYRENGHPERAGEYLGGVRISFLPILDNAWNKEIGVMGRFCTLLGIRSGRHGPYLVVRPVNAAAASELNLRASSILRNINKHFPEPWIKGIRIDSKI